MARAVTITKDNLAGLLKRVEELTGTRVLVGIPSTTAEVRPTPAGEVPQKGTPPNNAQLGYIHEFGAPASNIPPRPFLIPAIAGIQGEIAKQLRAVGVEMLQNRAERARMLYERLGLFASQAVKIKISTGPFQPIRIETALGRLRRLQRYQKADRAARAQMRSEWLGGVSPGMMAQGVVDPSEFKPLIDTGALRNAITYVVRKK